MGAALAQGPPTAPEYLPGTGMTNPTDFEADRLTLLGLLRRFTDFPATSNFAANPVLGPLSRRGWGRLAWRHIDHHLRQLACKADPLTVLTSPQRFPSSGLTNVRRAATLVFTSPPRRDDRVRSLHRRPRLAVSASPHPRHPVR